MCNDCEQTQLLRTIADTLERIEKLLAARLPVPPAPPKITGIDIQTNPPTTHPVPPTA